MIAKLKGILDSIGEDWAIVDVGGVGYHVTCSARTLAALPAPGEPATLLTETLVSENAIRLVGFASPHERDWFRLLDQVQGVGTRVAMGVLSTLTPAELASAIAMQDKATVARAPGVGPKMAQRIVSELRDKGPAVATGDAAHAALKGPAAAFAGPAADAVSALINLGYGQPQASAAIAAAARTAGEGAGTSDLIKLGLKELAR